MVPDLSFLSLKNDESESLKDDVSQKPDTPINKLSRIGEIRFSFDRGVLGMSSPLKMIQI